MLEVILKDVRLFYLSSLFAIGAVMFFRALKLVWARRTGTVTRNNKKKKGDFENTCLSIRIWLGIFWGILLMKLSSIWLLEELIDQLSEVLIEFIK